MNKVSFLVVLVCVLCVGQSIMLISGVHQKDLGIYYPRQDRYCVRADGSSAYVVNHEMGHHYWYKEIDGREQRWWKNEYKEALERGDLYGLIDDYALKSKEEFYAEAYAGWCENPTMYPETVVSRFEALEGVCVK